MMKTAALGKRIGSGFGIELALMVVLGLTAVVVSSDGTITVNPQPPTFAPELTLTGLRLRGRCLDIEVAEQQVTTDELAVTSAQSQIESAKLSLQQAEDTAAASMATSAVSRSFSSISGYVLNNSASFIRLLTSTNESVSGNMHHANHGTNGVETSRKDLS